MSGEVRELLCRRERVSLRHPHFRFKPIFHPPQAFPAELLTPRCRITHLLHHLQLSSSDVLAFLFQKATPARVVRVMSDQANSGVKTPVSRVYACPVGGDEVFAVLAQQPDKRLFRVLASARYVVHSELRVWLTRLREVKWGGIQG